MYSFSYCSDRYYIYYINIELNKSCLPENPALHMHLKEPGNTRTHVPFSQILSQFSFPTISEQLTPKTNGNSVDYYTETYRGYVLIMKFVCMNKATADAIYLNF